MIDWHQAGADPKNVPTCSKDDGITLIVCSNGKCVKYSTELPYPDEVSAPDAWGSGGYYAIGAMKFGATAEQAVKVAMECDVYTAGSVTVATVTPAQLVVKNCYVQDTRDPLNG
jgi:hypothetical protein